MEQVVIEGSQRRLRPVLMTACITALGLIPLIFSSGPGSEVQRPLAIVVFGGLLSSTFLTLILLPIMYRRFGAVDHERAGSTVADLWAGSTTDMSGATSTRSLESATRRDFSGNSKRWESTRFRTHFPTTTASAPRTSRFPARDRY